ncbi:DoxX family protein [Pseudarthrobacter sp. S9]|uniref:DoxX family protein n=1 Tax=Pseudarthrobacter sp. S9 TaxID=3418421 RepID=UPI003CFDD6CD
MPFSWSGRTTQTLSAAAMSALLLASAAKHFREPEFFDQVVPDFLCRDDSGARPNGPLAVLSREEWVAVSGLLEAAAAVGLLVPATRRAAAGCVTAMFTVFLTGHIDALRRAYSPDGTPRQRRAHSLRLPFQAPLILWGWSLTKRSPQTSGARLRP